MKTKQDLFRSIPSVDDIITLGPIKKLYENTSHQNIVECTRNVLDRIRKEIADLTEKETDSYKILEDTMIQLISKEVEKRKNMSLTSVINATGVILHTNLGRAPLSLEVKEALLSVACQYSTLEIDIATGKRGSRYSHVEDLICKLTGAEAAIVVNNNAAAVTLVLSSLAKDKEVIVSRGELVEIGGSFRIPEVMEQSGAKLVEVGATNKTHVRDYKQAISEETGGLLKVHTSNYQIVGFTQALTSKEIVDIAREYKVLAMEDVGSGVLVDLSSYGLSPEPTVQSTIQAGMDIVTFSGDKLLGGPQAGIIVGKRKYIESIKKHPLTRAFRIDKLNLVALEATLKIYDEEENLVQRIPTLRMLTQDIHALYEKALLLKNKIEKSCGNLADIQIEKSTSKVGGGSLPLEDLPTYVVTFTSDKYSISQWEEKLRQYKRPIFTRTYKEKIFFDVRTIFHQDIGDIIEAIKLILEEE